MPMKMMTPKDDFERILAGFELGKLIEVQTLPPGTVQVNVLLVTTKGKYVARFYQNRSLEYVKFELELLLFLSTLGYPSPVPIRDLNGSLLGTGRDKPMAIFTFMEGEPEQFPRGMRQAAAILARLHALTQDLRLDCQQFRDAYDPDSCSQSAKRSSAGLASRQEASTRVSWLDKQLQTVELPKHLPTGVCHCDPNPTNFLFRGNQLSAVLDSDMAAPVPFIYDVASLIYWWACPGGQTISFAAARQLVEAYEMHRPLAEIEKLHLYDALRMVMLLGLGWFADAPGFWSEAAGVEALSALGRDGFMHSLCFGTEPVR